MVNLYLFNWFNGLIWFLPLRIGIIKSRFHCFKHQILDLSSFLDFPSSGTPHLSLLSYQNTSTNIEKYMETCQKILFLHICIKKCQILKRRAPTNNEDPPNKSQKSWIRAQYLPEDMKWTKCHQNLNKEFSKKWFFRSLQLLKLWKFETLKKSKSGT